MRKHACDQRKRQVRGFVSHANGTETVFTRLKGNIIEAAEKLKNNGDIITPWAKKRLKDSIDQMVRVRLDEGVIIAEEVRL